MRRVGKRKAGDSGTVAASYQRLSVARGFGELVDDLQIGTNEMTKSGSFNRGNAGSVAMPSTAGCQFHIVIS